MGIAIGAGAPPPPYLYTSNLKLYELDANTLSLENLAGGTYKNLHLEELIAGTITGKAATTSLIIASHVTGAAAAERSISIQTGNNANPQVLVQRAFFLGGTARGSGAFWINEPILLDKIQAATAYNDSTGSTPASAQILSTAAGVFDLYTGAGNNAAAVKRLSISNAASAVATWSAITGHVLPDGATIGCAGAPVVKFNDTADLLTITGADAILYAKRSGYSEGYNVFHNGSLSTEFAGYLFHVGADAAAPTAGTLCGGWSVRGDKSEIIMFTWTGAAVVQVIGIVPTTGVATFRTGITIDTGQVLKVGANQVVGAQGLAVADATDAASTMARLNDLLARCRAHGLIAT